MQVTKDYEIKSKKYKLYHSRYRQKISIIERFENYLKASIKNFRITLPIAITLFSSFVYFLVYLYNFVYFRYYSIDIAYYNLSIQQTLSLVVIWLYFFMILIFMIFYKYSQNKKKNNAKVKKWKKIIEYFYNAIGLFIFTIAESFLLLENFTIYQIPIQYIVNFIICIIIYRYIFNYFNKKGGLYNLKTEIKDSTKEKGGIFINFIVIIICIIFVIIIYGLINAFSKKSFKIVSSEEMIIYEKEDNVSVECNIVLYCNNTLCIATKGKIEKVDGKYNLIFDDISQKNTIELSKLSYKMYTFNYIKI